MEKIQRIEELKIQLSEVRSELREHDKKCSEALEGIKDIKKFKDEIEELRKQFEKGYEEIFKKVIELKKEIFEQKETIKFESLLPF